MGFTDYLLATMTLRLGAWSPGARADILYAGHKNDRPSPQHFARHRTHLAFTTNRDISAQFFRY